MGNSTKELVNAFNLNNYFSDRVNTNFTVDGQKIVGLFADDTDVAKYLSKIGKEIIKQQYLGRKVVASKYYNLNCFPFVLGANPRAKESGIKGVMQVKLADSTNREVIRNLKMHLINEFDRAVILKVVARLQEAVGITEEEAHEWAGETFRIQTIDKSSPYLYCIVFSDEYLRSKGYDSEDFELLKEEYIKEFNSRLRKCGLKSSDFYDYKDSMLYIKDVSDKVVKSVAEYVRERIALSFRVPGKQYSKIENFKDVLGNLIFKWTSKPVNAYGYDIFAGKEKIKSGNSFVLIPLTKADSEQLESLKHKDAYKINAVHKGIIRDIRCETEKPSVTNCKNPVYAFSNKGIAQLLPEIIQSPIAYNERTGHFEFAVNLEDFKSKQKPFSPESHGSSVHLELTNGYLESDEEGAITPPAQTGAKFFEGKDSGYDSNSPPKSERGQPVSAVAVKSVEQSSPRHESGLLSPMNVDSSNQSQQSIGAAVVGVDESEQGACGRSPPLAPGEKDRVSSKSGSESPKKHRGGPLCSNSFIGSKLSKLKDNFTSSLKLNGKGRNSVYSMSSSVSAPVSFVSEKQPDPKQHNTFPTRKGGGNLPSEVCSPARSPSGDNIPGSLNGDVAGISDMPGPSGEYQENPGTFNRGAPGRDSGCYPNEKRPVGSSACPPKSGGLSTSSDSGAFSGSLQGSSRKNFYYSPRGFLVTTEDNPLSTTREVVEYPPLSWVGDKIARRFKSNFKLPSGELDSSLKVEEYLQKLQK